MKKIIKISTIASALLLPSLVQAQATSSSEMEITANVSPGCLLSADNINFGNLAMPISDQSAVSNMVIKCSNNAPLTIGISFNGNASSGGNYTYKTIVTYANQQSIKIYKDGEAISNGTEDLYCHKSYQGKVLFYTIEASNIYGYSSVNLDSWISDTKDICKNYGGVNIDTLKSLGADVGSLQGLVKKENIKYFLENPSDSSKKWGTSVGNNYSLLANGNEQIIRMKSHIKRADNPTHRMSPDTYQDNLTVVLTY